jgi:hypothetical protein
VCVRGASALGDLLAAHPRADVRVIVIWLPVIDTDRGPPQAAVRRSLADPRVVEFWDPHQWASPRMLARSIAGGSGGVAWDVVAVYPPGAVWADPFPAPSWSGRPVVDQEAILDGLLAVPLGEP